MDYPRKRKLAAAEHRLMKAAWQVSYGWIPRMSVIPVRVRKRQATACHAG